MSMMVYRHETKNTVQDVRYVIHTITFFAVSCPENSAFFRKNRQIFEKNPRKILHILNILEKCCILLGPAVLFSGLSAPAIEEYWNKLSHFLQIWVLVVAARCAASVVDIMARHPPPHRRLDRGRGAAAPRVRGKGASCSFYFSHLEPNFELEFQLLDH